MSTPEHRRLIPTDVPGVYKRGSRYVAIWRHRGERVKTYHRTKAAAKRAKAAADAGDTQPTNRERFDSYARRWCDEYQGRTNRGLAPSTRDDYRALIELHAIPFFGSMRMADIGPLDVRKFIEHLAKQAPKRKRGNAERITPATVRRILTPVKAMLAEAYELEVIKTNPGRVRVVVRGEQRVKPPKTLAPEQVAGVLAAMPPAHRILFAFLSRTGVRISEALGAKWGDIQQTSEGPVFTIHRQFYRGELREEAKSEASARSVALVPSLMRDLMRHRATTPYGRDDDPMFASMTGSHRDYANVRRSILTPAAEAAGVPWVTPHVFRHSLATELRDRGYGADVIAKVLGHTDEAFTRRVYIHTRDTPRFDDLDGPIVEAADG
jgi:integrase